MDNPEPAAGETNPQDHGDEPGAAHERRELNEVVERLSSRFPQVAADRIRTVVDTAHRRFDGSPIRDFVPVFVERAAKDALLEDAVTVADRADAALAEPEHDR